MSKNIPWKLPLNSNEMMFAESLIDNSGLTVTNTWVSSFYRLYFYNKIFSIIQIKNLPDSMDMRFFKNVLLSRGYIGIFNTEEYGLICNNSSISDFDIYYNPTKLRAVNPKFKMSYERILHKDACIVKLYPNFETVLPFVYYFADLMAVAVQGIDSNVLNSKLAYVFGCENQTQANTFKKMFDEIANGYPAVFADKKLYDDEGNLKMELFNRSVKDTYIADKLMELKNDIENDFNMYIGLSAVNTDKKERLITSEVELANSNNRLLVELWRDTIKEGLNEVNKMFNTNMDVTLNINYINDNLRGDENVQTETRTDVFYNNGIAKL